MKLHAQKQPQPPQQASPGASGSHAKLLAARSPTCFAHDFSRITLHSTAYAHLPPKLAISSPGDISEREADRVAEHVTNVPATDFQRCACGSGCPNCGNEQVVQGHLQTKRGAATASGQISAPPIDEILNSAGQPIESSTRKFMEWRFGHDFSRVRVHTDASAAESADALRARAYTFGQHIAFGAGQYQPHLKEGRQLLAHELTHTLQQRAINLPALQRQATSDDPVVKTETPSPRATMLLQMFSNRPMSGKFSFKDIDCSVFEREYDASGAWRETIKGMKNGIPWTFTFVRNDSTYFSDDGPKTEVTSTFVKEHQDGTQIVNCYQRVNLATTGYPTNWNVGTDNSIFEKESGQFSLGSAEFLEFYEKMDAALLGNKDVFHTPFIIVIDGQKDALNIQRANTLKEDLIKRGANEWRISITFTGKAGSAGIDIKTDFKEDD